MAIESKSFIDFKPFNEMFWVHPRQIQIGKIIGQQNQAVLAGHVT
jgi:hypothetical protein